MKKGTSSSTAWGVALGRIAHVRFDEAPPLFDDSLALDLIPPEVVPMLDRFGPTEGDLEAIRRARAYLPFRQRFQEERLDAGYRRGVRQFVLLGAGLDAYAFRQPEERRDLHIFEVDFPDTQNEKQARIRELGWAVPENLHFTPCDFESETLTDALARTGFDPSLPSYFAWMGVTVYLAEKTIRQTLREVRALAAPGSSLAFEYALPYGQLEGTDLLARDFSLRQENRKNEPFVSTFTTEEIGAMVAEEGWPRFDALDHDQAEREVLAGRSDGLSLRMGFRLAEVFA